MSYIVRHDGQHKIGTPVTDGWCYIWFSAVLWALGQSSALGPQDPDSGNNLGRDPTVARPQILWNTCLFNYITWGSLVSVLSPLAQL